MNLFGWQANVNCRYLAKLSLFLSGVRALTHRLREVRFSVSKSEHPFSQAIGYILLGVKHCHEHNLKKNRFIKARHNQLLKWNSSNLLIFVMLVGPVVCPNTLLEFFTQSFGVVNQAIVF